MNRFEEALLCICFLTATFIGTALLYAIFGPWGIIGTLFFTGTALFMVEMLGDDEEDK